MAWRGACTWSARRFAGRLGLGFAVAAALWAPQASATERALSLYLLGSGAPQSAIMPPLPGVYFSNTFYNYDGSAAAAKQFEFGGIVVAGVHAEYPLDFPAVTFVPTTDLFGGTLAVSAVLPFGAPFVHVDTIITGPKGGVFTPQLSDSAVVVGDPLTTAALGWKQGNFHEAVSTIINYPVGEYRVRRLANLALHRWAEDVSFAGSWHDDKAGWDVSAKAGVTWNGENGSTDYISGTESHYEASVEKIVSKIFSVGLQAYRFDQLTGDTGSGDHIGPFKGEVSGFGGTAAWNFNLVDRPASLRVQGFHEVEAVNRLEGSAVFLLLSFPINVQAPPAPPPGALHP